MTPVVIDIDAAATHDLRRRVLRAGTTSTEVVFAHDDADDTVHLGVSAAGRIVAISTWILRPHPADTTRAGRRLRGMATDPAVRGHGHGSLLLRTGVERARGEGIEIVWANARTSALAFYRAHGFELDGPEFVDTATGLAHRRILLRIGSVRPPNTPTVG